MTTTKASHFQQEKKDPGFLAAKGNFKSMLQGDKEAIFRKRDHLLTNQGLAGDSPEVVALTKQLHDLEQQISQEQDTLERKHIKKLAGAIFMAVSKHKYANIRAIGDRAVYNAVRAYEIADGYCLKENLQIFIKSIEKSEGNMGSLRNSYHVSNVTAYLFKIETAKNNTPNKKETNDNV